MDEMAHESLAAVLPRIAERATRYDVEAAWPVEDLAELSDAGAMRWAIARAHGGEDVDAETLHGHYEHVAAASLATALLISQRDAAVGYIESSANESLKERLLPRLAQNLNVSIDGTDETLASRLEGLAVSAGSACATGRIEPSHVLRALGVDAARAHGTLRFGLHRFTTDADIDRAIAIVQNGVARLRDERAARATR